MTKRPYGSGSITTRGNSKRLRYYGPPDANGHREIIHESLRGVSQREAQRVLAERLAAVESGGFIARDAETVAGFCEHWFKTHAEVNLGLKTQQGYRGLIDRYIVPGIGSIRLQALEPRHIQTMLAELTRRGLGQTTALHTYRLLHRILSDAVRWNLIGRNVVAAVTPPRVKRREAAVWTVEQFETLLESAPVGVVTSFFNVAAHTGLRRSELAGLQWRDIDLVGQRLSVVRTLQRITGHGLVIGTPKSANSRRTIKLGARAVKILEAVRVQQLVEQVAAGELYDESGHVFTDELGRRVDPDRMGKAFAKIVRPSGLPRLGLHSLRHLHASILLAQGVDLKTTSARLGHSQIGITADLYSHVSVSLQDQAAQAVDDALASG